MVKARVGVRVLPTVHFDTHIAGLLQDLPESALLTVHKLLCLVRGQRARIERFVAPNPEFGKVFGDKLPIPRIPRRFEPKQVVQHDKEIQVALIRSHDVLAHRDDIFVLSDRVLGHDLYVLPRPGLPVAQRKNQRLLLTLAGLGSTGRFIPDMDTIEDIHQPNRGVDSLDACGHIPFPSRRDQCEGIGAAVGILLSR